MTTKFFSSCRASHGRHFEYPCYGGLTNQKIFLSIWKKVFSSFLLLFHVYQTSLRDQYFRFRSSKNHFFLRLVQYLAFYGPDDHNFYFKVTPWPYTKSEICICCGCKALRAAWRTGKQSLSVQNRLKLVESTFKVIVHFRFRSSKNQFFYVWFNISRSTDPTTTIFISKWHPDLILSLRYAYDVVAKP